MGSTGSAYCLWNQDSTPLVLLLLPPPAARLPRPPPAAHPPPSPPCCCLLQVLAKLEASLAAGQYYEAHEMFKTVYYRHRARNQAAASYELCQQGARLQLCGGQLNCGLELCLLLVEAYVADGVAPGQEGALQRVLQLIEAFPRQGGRPEGAGGSADPPVAECAKFAAAAVRWIRG